MAIDFSPSRWDKVKQAYRLFWEGRLDRPILPVEIVNRTPDRPQPSGPPMAQQWVAKLDIPVADFVDRADWELSKLTFLGDAFPIVNLSCFGPGILAGFLGARVDDSSGRIWFHPPRELPIQDIHFEYDADNPYFRRVKDLCAAMMKRWQGQVLVTMADLGGTVDILSTFRPSERLLLDLYDHPDDVKRLTWEVHELWHRYFREINDVLQPVNPGYSEWASIYSEEPHYMLQCDFAYMIGPDMFNEFVLPELAATTQRLPRSFYHLDGVGQLPHMDQLLSLPKLDGVQWVPGDGKPDGGHWPDVQRKIAAAGKKIQTVYGLDSVDAIASQIGTARGIQMRVVRGWAKQEADLRARLAKYGLE